MVRAPQKALKIGRALKSAARYPVQKVAIGKAGSNQFSPLPNEVPIVILRVQVASCTNLLAKDKNGFSDPFVVVSVLGTRHQTPVLKRTCNPVYNPKDATFDFPLHLSLADKLGVIELVIWDKDMLKKDYLGEVSIPLEDWFRNGNPYQFSDPSNQPYDFPVVSTRVSTQATGTIQVKLGFEYPPNVAALMELSDVYDELVKLSRPSLMSAPPTEGIGTIRSHQTGPQFEDDGLSSDEESDDDDDDLPPGSHSLSKIFVPPKHSTSATTEYSTPSYISDIQQTQPIIVSQSPSPMTTPTTTHLQPPVPPSMSTTSSSQTITNVQAPQPQPARSSSGFSISKILPRRPGSTRSSSVDSTMMASTLTQSSSGAPTLSTPPTSAPGSGANTPVTPRPPTKSSKFRKSWVGGSKKAGYNFSATSNDIVGIVMLEIVRANDLPKLKNMTRTGWDMDPFVVISFGKKVFRTRVIRHSIDPVWDEKLLFHVRRYETNFKLQLTVSDWDKLSANDQIAHASVNVHELVQHAPQKDEKTGLYSMDEKLDVDKGMKEFELALSTAKEMPWESKHNPTLVIRAKYQPYDALRQRFWRQYLKQYDTDDTGTISNLELTSMLDSLGSTLSRGTTDSFFTRFGKRPHEDSLTMDEAVLCLETELCRPAEDKKRINYDESAHDTSVPVTPSLVAGPDNSIADLNLDKLDFAGPVGNQPNPENTNPSKPAPPPAHPTDPMEQPIVELTAPTTVTGTTPTPRATHFDRQPSSNASSDAEDSSPGSSSPASEDNFERVINVKNCPLCHRPRLSSKAEVDIVTHLAVCASQDWARVDKIVVGNFVTASQAQRKWYTKVISKVSAGNYKLGANSANIIVQNRLTGQLEEEKMQVYVRLGIRLLYKGWKSRMEGGRARRLLKSLSIKQGIKYDDPESARDIPAFIEFHNLDVNEILDPLPSFKTFNEFFYRKLKPDARPVENPEDPYRLVSGADCRLMAFETVQEATRLWIKGREFTVSRLLGEKHRAEADKYVGGALCIFRLAPQDYHRFHVPVDGVIGPMTDISGEYYTVNPQAIRTALDVYGENVRKIVPIDSPQFGRVMMVCVGAMMVGSIKMTVEEGQQVKRGQEFGYFAFGGSTIVVLFEKGVVEFDEDLLINSRACLETLVRVGMGIGRRRRPPLTSSSSELAK
ncbi:phosphatidylserine decarboxylase-domain-containing protein [Cristinia sonorae]|uniref:Phosphatidylserine decarboxylase proenzyme 2 n=1 Tax=Cristinia sonorae TaxID=1940300 RepID=A0A8K0XM53_9AGAR|nr:phosphatidylserine decarboxylase-domain-containing protein [Cristinia sonorae]